MIFKTIAIIFITTSISIYTTVSQAEQDIFIKYQSDLNEWNIERQSEKIYLHIDKPYYMAGETIWFSMYLRNAQNLTESEISKVVYVELINPDGRIIDSRTVLSEPKTSNGNFDLPASLAAGYYRIRAYTSWMRNFDESNFYDHRFYIHQIPKAEENNSAPLYQKNTFSKSVSEKSIDLQFFSEGGNLLLNTEQVLGFKSIDQSGLGIAFKGWIHDSSGKIIVEFKSNELGMGSFTLIPDGTQQYYATIEGNSEQYPLPIASTTAASLKVINERDSVARIEIIFSDQHYQNKKVTLTVISSNQMILIKSFDGSVQKRKISMPLGTIRNGEMIFTLFNDLDEPISERVIFVYHKPKHSITQLDKSYIKRGKVNVGVTLAYPFSGIQSGRASMSVVDLKVMDTTKRTSNIVSELLLSSELKGYVENADWYFEDYNDYKRKALDALLLTQGWRSFRWIQYLNDDPPKYNFIAEKGLTITGQVSKYEQEEAPQKAEISITSLKGNLVHEQWISDDNGRFTYTGMVHFDTIDYFFQAKKFNEKKQKVTNNNNLSISLMTLDPPRVQTDSSSQFEIIETASLEKEVLKIEQIERAFGEQTIILDELTVTGSQIDKEDPFDRAGKLHSQYEYRIVMDSLGNVGGLSLWNFANTDGRLARLLRTTSFSNVNSQRITNPDGEEEILGEERSVPIFLDGFQLTEFEAKSYLMNGIAFVEVINTFDAAMYGSNGTSSGAIMFYSGTNGYSPSYVVRGVNSIKLPGYNLAKTFYEPKYEIDDQEMVKPDRRITLHWQPYLTFNENGQASTSFYTDDKPTTYEIRIEGISDSGTPFVISKTFVNR